MNALIAKVEAAAGKGALGVVGFPSNIFGLQEPASTYEELMNGIKYVRPGGGFVPNFPLAQKCDVNGDKEHPLFTFVKGVCPNPLITQGPPTAMYWSPVKQTDITWNYEKFLIDADGRPHRRYTPTVDPRTMYDDVISLVRKAGPSNNASNKFGA